MFKSNFTTIVLTGKSLAESKLTIKTQVASSVEVSTCFIVCKVPNNSMNNLNLIIHLQTCIEDLSLKFCLFASLIGQIIISISGHKIKGN